MDRFLCAQAFITVAERQSFSEAARQLGVTPSVITSRVKQLEQLMRVPLFHRSTRSVTFAGHLGRELKGFRNAYPQIEVT